MHILQIIMHTIMTWKWCSHYWPFVRGIYQSLVDSPYKRPVMWSFDIFFFVTLNKLLNKLSACQWFEIPWCSSDITNVEPFSLGQVCNLCPLLYFPCASVPVRNIGEHIHLKMNDFWTKIYPDDILSHFQNESLIIIHHALKQQLFLDSFITRTNCNFDGFEFLLHVWNPGCSGSLKWITYQ